MSRKLFGIVGWSGAGKTTLIEKLLPALRAEGLSVSTIKHAHHGFDIDRPGKDSFRHREAGAAEVMVVAGERWALLHELRDAVAPPLAELVARMAPVDLILVEGFKADPHPKIEVYRGEPGTALCTAGDPTALAVASDRALPDGYRGPRLDLDDPAAIARFIIAQIG